MQQNKSTLILKNNENVDKVIETKKKLIYKSDKTAEEKRKLFSNYKEKMNSNRNESVEMKNKREAKEIQTCRRERVANREHKIDHIWNKEWNDILCRSTKINNIVLQHRECERGLCPKRRNEEDKSNRVD